MSQVFEVKVRKVGNTTPWETKKTITQVAENDQDVVLYWAQAMYRDNSIDEVRWVRKGSINGNYITSQMATRIAEQERQSYKDLPGDRLDMLCMTLVNAMETGTTDYWTTHTSYDYQERGEKMIDAWARITVWSEDDNDGKRFFITPTTINMGIRKIVDDPAFQINQDLWKAIAWADKHPADADLDSEMADCIIQAALFGELVYG